MLNELLTGKASLEPRPEPTSPYRELGVLPPLRHRCTACGQSYEAPAGSTPGRCPTCHVAMVEQNAAESARLAHEAQQRLRRERRNRRVVRVLLLVAVGAGLRVMRYEMKKQMRDDAAQAVGYHDYADYEADRDTVYPTDEFSYRVQDFANEMCACTDLACARNLLAQYTQYIRANAPSDDAAKASADHDARRLGDCEAKLEN